MLFLIFISFVGYSISSPAEDTNSNNSPHIALAENYPSSNNAPNTEFQEDNLNSNNNRNTVAAEDEINASIILKALTKYAKSSISSNTAQAENAKSAGILSNTVSSASLALDELAIIVSNRDLSGDATSSTLPNSVLAEDELAIIVSNRALSEDDNLGTVSNSVLAEDELGIIVSNEELAEDDAKSSSVLNSALAEDELAIIVSKRDLAEDDSESIVPNSVLAKNEIAIIVSESDLAEVYFKSSIDSNSAVAEDELSIIVSNRDLAGDVKSSMVSSSSLEDELAIIVSNRDLVEDDPTLEVVSNSALAEECSASKITTNKYLEDYLTDFTPNIIPSTEDDSKLNIISKRALANNEDCRTTNDEAPDGLVKFWDKNVPCVFPYTISGQITTYCSGNFLTGSDMKGCATQVDENGAGQKYGVCNQNCQCTPGEIVSQKCKCGKVEVCDVGETCNGDGQCLGTGQQDCSCDFHDNGFFNSGGCTISFAAPRGFKCKCKNISWIKTCTGIAELCKTGEHCPKDCIEESCCIGNCDGYTFSK